MRSKVAQRILSETPEEVKVFARMYGDLIVLINSILKDKGYTQKSFADRLGKRPSEVHKWLSGEHNFTLRSIAKMQAELHEALLEIPVHHASKTFFITCGKRFSSYSPVNPTSMKVSVKHWRPTNLKYSETPCLA